MSMLSRFLLSAALAMAGTALAVPAATQFEKNQIAPGRQELDKNKPAGASSYTQPVAAASEDANKNPSVSSTDAKAKKKNKDKNKAKPAPSKEEEEFDRMLLGIHG